MRPARFVRQGPFLSAGWLAVLALMFTACGARSRSGAGSGEQSAAGSTQSSGGSAGVVGVASGGGASRFDCRAVASQQFDATVMQSYALPAQVTSSVTAALAQMSFTDQVSQMTGVQEAEAEDFSDISRSPDATVAGLGTIRGFHFRNGGHGVSLVEGQNNRRDDGNDFSTAFPATSVRAASWDLELEKRIGEAIGDETAAAKNNLLLAPCMNIIRHPYWGRTQETYGEDMYHLGRMATAFTVGVQEYVTACAKHFAANNIEKGRAIQNAVMNEQTLREIYGRHFEMVVRDGAVGCVMASYNKVNGLKNTQNKHLLRDVLKGPIAEGGFGFQGFVISDQFGMPGDQNVEDDSTAQELTSEAVLAGLDVEQPRKLHYSTTTLAQVDPSLIEQAAQRVLTQKYRFQSALSTDGWSLRAPSSVLADGSIAANPDHEALAEQAELESAVLLWNGAPNAPLLPISGASNIAVVGLDQAMALETWTFPKSCGTDGHTTPCLFHYATDPAVGDRGSSAINADPARSLGPFAGIQAAAGSSRQVTSGNSVEAAANADTVVVVVGYSPGDEGEEIASVKGGDRSTLDLPSGQNEFVNRVLDLGKPTVIIVESGSIVNLPWLSHANQNQATVWAGYPGSRGAAALGKLLFGAANFSGKMPLAWPTQSELDQMPFKDSDVETKMGYFFGYREYDRRRAAGQPVDLVFPFGHGLSYSSFRYSNLRVPCEAVEKDAIVEVSVDIQNTSAVDGDEIAMLFVEPPPKPSGITGDRPVKELKSFARVSVRAGQTVTAELPLRIADLRRWEGNESGKWRIDSGDYTILVGKDAGDAETAATRSVFTVHGD